MSLAEWTIVVSTSSVCLLNCLLALNSLRPSHRLRRLSDVQASRPEVWPRVSVIIPACDEESTLEAALSTIRDSSYPNLEVILVDDRSTDATGEIMERVAAADDRFRTIHIESLPSGWLGKVHALHCGMAEARGEWVLFTDADVHLAPDLLHRTVALGVNEGLDHVAVLPALEAESFVLRATITAFGVGFLTTTRAHSIGAEGSDAFAGVGAFNLVRRAHFDTTEGFEWLKMEVGDDVGLGYLMHRHGGRAAFLDGWGFVSVRWYASVSDMVHGLEKSGFGLAARYSYTRAALLMTLTPLILVAPFVALTQWQLPWLVAVGALGLAAVGVLYGTGGRITRYGWRPSVLGELGVLVILYALARSTFVCWRQGGIRWRGTLYPLDELRAGRRVNL